MSSPQNTSDEVEEIKNCPDRADEITTISNNDVENLNESPLNEGSIKFDAPFESKIEESLGCKGDMSIEPPNVENLELGCDDDFDDGIEILNEEALLNEGVELDEDIIKVQEEKNNIEIQNQEISLEEAEKITKKGILTDTKDLQSLTSDILGQTQKVNKECEIDDNFQVILLEDEKELENESLVKEQNLCCIDENQKQEELNNITIDENEKIDTGVAAEGNTSTISQHSSYQQITEHGLNKPDMMLEIPTQEFIEFSDESGDDEESAETTLKMSPDVEVIDIEVNNCIDDNMINIEEERIVSTQENLLKSVDMDMTVLEDPKATIDALQAIDESHESCEDVNMEVTDCQNDISTNALSYEAEIAAEIITKEMNNINDETFTKNIDLIDQEDEEEKLTEELNSSLVSKPDKEISSKLILKETADADIIELSDDNIEIELEDSESSSGESLSDQKAKFKKAIASAELEEDILHDAEEIDNLILTTKISKTKIIEDSIKLSDNLSSSCTKTCEKRKLELTTNMNVSETKDSLEMSILNDSEEIDNLILTTKISKTKIIEESVKLSDNFSRSCRKTCEKNTLEPTTNVNVSATKTSQEISRQNANKTDTKPNKIAMDTSDEIPVSTTAKNLDDMVLDKLTKKEDITDDVSNQIVLLPDNLQISTAEIKAAEVHITRNISYQPDNFKSPKESSPVLDRAGSILATHPESNSKQNSASEEELPISKAPEWIKHTTEPIIQCDPILSSKINLVLSENSECENEKTQEIELNNASKLSSSNFKVVTEKFVTSEHNNEPVSYTEESMEVDSIEQSTCTIETASSETVHSKLSTLNIELKPSEMDESKTSEIVESHPISKIDHDIPEMDRPQQTTSNIELEMTEIDGPQLSTAKIEQASEIDGPLPSKIESTTLEIIVKQPTSMIEQKPSEINEPSTSKIITPEISGPTSSSSKISSEMVITTPSESKIEPTTSAPVETAPPTLKIETITSEIDVLTPTTTNLEPITSETCRPTALPSEIEPTLSVNIDKKQSTSKIELAPSDPIPPQSSSSKIKSDTSETVEPQPTLKIEQITSEIDVLTSTTTNLEPITSEALRPTALPSKIEPTLSINIDQKQSTTKIELVPSEPVPPQPSSSKIESNTAETVELQPALNIEQITSEVDVSTPSTTNLQPITSETLRPTALPLRVEPTMSVNIDQKQSTSKIELVLSESLAPQSSSSKIESSTSETVEPQPSTSKIELQTSKSNEPQPSTSKIELETSESNEPQPSTSKIELQTSESNEPQPSTSKCNTEAMDSKPSSPKDQSAFDLLIQDSSNDVPEMTDSLGLLAESSRVMEDDEEHDDDDDDDGDDEDDFEPDDESSNQMTAEHSEDSNTHQSESDVAKDTEMPNDENQGFDLDISESIIEKEPEKMVCDEDKADEITETEKAIDDEGLDNNEAENEIKAEVMDDETVKISDTSDTEDNENTEGETPRKSSDSNYKEWTRTKKLSISKQCSSNVMSYVDLEESSSDEDKKQPQPKTTTVVTKSQTIAADGISGEDLQNEPKEVKEAETSSSESLQPALEKDVVKPKEPQVVARPKSPSSAVPPETHSKETEARSPKGLEVFSLDSDEEDSSVQQSTDDTAAVTQEPRVDQPKLRGIKCINRHCDNSEPAVGYYFADTSTAMYFEADTGKRAYVCEKCADMVEKRNQELIEGMKKFTPLFQLHTARHSEELVEISDSDSDGEPEPTAEQLQIVGTQGAKMLEEQLADMINETWAKFKMDDRILEAQNDLQKEMERLQKESQAIDAMFNECQAATDRLRNSLYATFDPDIQELPSIVIYDTPNCSYSCLEPPTNERRQYKRRLSPSKDTLETPAKKPATPSPATPVLPEAAPQDSSKEEQEPKTPVVEKVDDDNMDISVVTLAAESAPADLPPPGDLSHPPLKVGMTVYAMKNAFGTWLRAKVVEIQPKMHNMPFTMARVRFEHKVSKNPFKTLPARCLAYFEPSEVRMTIGTRVIALFKSINARQAYYSGIVAEIPNPVNNYRYLIFFDDGYAQYAPHSQTRLVCEFSSLVWEEVHPYSREFVRSYLLAYPERPMVRLHAGQNLKTEWRGKWWSSRVVSVDSSLVEVQFLRCDRREWIYRGSTRLAPLYLELQAAERHRPRALPRTQPRTQPQARINMPYVEYTRSDEQANKLPQTIQQRQQQLQQQNEELRRQRAVAKKSTALSMPPPQSNSSNFDPVSSRVVYYTPKNAVKPYKMTPHTCSPNCKRTDVLALKDLRTYNPLAKPLLSGWERQVVRYKGNKEVMYVAPCGRRLRDVRELHRYLRTVDSDMPVDLFDFSASTHCLAEFVLNKCLVGKKDLSHGKELVPVPCVNYYDESLPEFCSYNTERTPTAGVPLNLDPEFLCGCDCEDDCEDKTKCACWKMTLEGARTIGYEGDVGYVYRRLPEPLPSGIYECNSRCKCKNTCLNRVAQHPLQLKLQVFKTHNRGWGIRALNDVPKGAFLCIYAGNLLTDATANLDGLNEGDEYLAELDYIEVVEQMKEGFEEDIPDSIKAKDKKELSKKQAEDDDEDDEEEESSEEETTVNKNEREDGDFEPGYIGLGVAEFSKRLRKRDSKKEAEDAKQQEKEKEANGDDECITISDDEEVREPSCFTAAAGMGKNQFISKYRSVRTLFGEDEACYIMDAKVQGNIGRYLNHSCTPNVFVQNVFVDTHDPRFPWVAFFALHHIRAGTELTWNYNYDVGSVPGKVLYCFCGAPNCRGRLL